MSRPARVLLVAWLFLSLAGAVNHTLGEKLWGRRFDLKLPHLASGYVMFVRIPRSAEVHEYVNEAGERRSVSELVDARGLLYARARTEANLALYPGLLLQICQRQYAKTKRPTTFIRDEYKLNFHPERPVSSRYFRCDERGLSAIPPPR